jgi:hypothetical protein
LKWLLSRDAARFVPSHSNLLLNSLELKYAHFADVLP